MSHFTLHLDKKNFPKALTAFEFVRALSESELETLEILSDKKNVTFLEQSLGESKRNKVVPLESIL